MSESIQKSLQELEAVIPGDDPRVAQALAKLKGHVKELKKQPNLGMVHASVRDLKRAFSDHYSASSQIDQASNKSSASLLLFYAVECGLKGIWLKDRRFNGTEKIPRDMLSNHGHDLVFWIKELRVSKSAVPENLNFHLKKSNRSPCNLDISKAHEAWRYGVAMEPEDHHRLKQCLNKFCQDWIKERI